MSKTRWTGKAPLLVILGATATGKTGLALQLAESLDGEIVGADSRQIYRGMDIGTAKPNAEQRARVRHHLVDIADPDENPGLATIQGLANAAIADIQRRGRLPLLVGGTGQYLSAIVEGWRIPEVPPNVTLRSELEAYARSQGSGALHRRLAEVDPATAARTHPNNVRRVVRSLEVWHATGSAISEQQKRLPPPWKVLQLGLQLERGALYARADQRLETMIKAGFVGEVRDLLRAGYSRDLPSMSGLGYRQLAAHLLDGLPLPEAIDTARTATHDFIRRQLTWFRGHHADIRWLDAASLDTQAIADDLRRWLADT
ncbi:MAG: tRNA (adenosine(37)-N6)-dimethylallyltransferase MiaA [Anaerolineaceae bacterium]|nr:tRNA (adenosine(37)-N6)-dimethylallyltransferase MiaA [Anaerolineaceae bacterium]